MVAAGPQQLPAKTASAQSVLPTKGLIEHGTYKNTSIGLEFMPAGNLHLQEPELKGTPGTTPLLITVQAVSDRSLFSGLSLTTFYADALSYYPEEQRNAQRYLQKIIRTNEADGFQRVESSKSEQFGGLAFLRADFVQGNAYETVLVVTHDAYAFVFIFAGSDVGVTNKLIASTNVKFTF